MGSQWQIESLAVHTRHALHLSLDPFTEIPFTVLVGQTHTPLALILAGVHGDEYEGPTAILDLAAEIDVETLTGSILFVPFANPAAFAAGTRRHPVDKGDLNRSFPGDPAGGPTAQLAHLLFQEFVLVANCIFSLHGWSKEAQLLPYAEYPESSTEAARISREAAYALGFHYLHPYQWPAGVLGNAAGAYQIPIVEGEVGGIGSITKQGQQLYREAILRFLDYFGIFPLNAAAPLEPKIISHIEILAAQAGLFQSSVEIGERVSAGQQLGLIRALDGSCLQIISSPGAGTIGVQRTIASVQPDNLLSQVFQEREEL
jgi:predicted deacylase